MDDFLGFVTTYKDDIAAFFEALVAWIKAIIAKINENDAATDETV